MTISAGYMNNFNETSVFCVSLLREKENFIFFCKETNKVIIQILYRRSHSYVTPFTKKCISKFVFRIIFQEKYYLDSIFVVIRNFSVKKSIKSAFRFIMVNHISKQLFYKRVIFHNIFLGSYFKKNIFFNFCGDSYVMITSWGIYSSSDSVSVSSDESESPKKEVSSSSSWSAFSSSSSELGSESKYLTF